jgi:1-phosphofructokinase family hexose kinase
MILCSAACPSVDKLFAVDRLQPGAVHRPLEFVQLPGGKAINVARATIALGAEAEVVALVGGHAGRWLLEELHQEGVPVRRAWTTVETRASLSVLDRDAGALTEFYEAGERIAEGEWDAFEAAVEAALLPGAWLVTSGSAPRGAPVDAHARLVCLARDRGVMSAVDARGDALAAALDARPGVVKANADEAGELVGEPVATGAAALAAAQWMRARAGGDGHVAIVTRGVDGAVMIAPDGSAFEGRLDARGPYPVGSGDAFLAGLLVGRERGEEWRDAFTLALAAAAANAECPGPGRLEPGRVDALRSRGEVILRTG